MLYVQVYYSIHSLLKKVLIGKIWAQKIDTEFITRQHIFKKSNSCKMILFAVFTSKISKKRESKLDFKFWYKMQIITE